MIEQRWRDVGAIVAIALTLGGCGGYSSPAINVNDSTTATAMPPVPDGTFEGTYRFNQQTSRGAEETIEGPVTLVLQKGVYQVRGERRYYPPAGGGTYEQRNDVLIFDDKMVHTADFDWSLLVQGSFDCWVSGDTLLLSQNDVERLRFRELKLLRTDPNPNWLGPRESMAAADPAR